MDIKITTELPREFSKALRINEHTIFITSYKDGKLIIEPIIDYSDGEEDTSDIPDESPDEYEDGYKDGFSNGIDTGHKEGYSVGYRKGYLDSKLGRKYNNEMPDEAFFDEDEVSDYNTED